MIIPCVYEQAREFEDGVAWVRKGDKWGLIDKTNKYIIKPVYRDIDKFREGIARVKTFQHDTCYVNRKGDLIAKDFKFGKPFSEGLAAVKFKLKGEKASFGFINMAGKCVIPPQFKDCGLFSEGLCSVEIKKRWGFIDRTGKFVIEPQYFRTLSFNDGIAGVITENGMIGYLNPDGTFLVKPKFYDGGEFSSNLAPVFDGKKWGFIDKKGEYKIKPKYRFAASFSEGLAAVQY